MSVRPRKCAAAAGQRILRKKSTAGGTAAVNTKEVAQGTGLWGREHKTVNQKICSQQKIPV